jgi:aminoglycoside-2''-adenylyltransferase
LASLLEEFTNLVAELERREIPYAVCGGWAMAIHGAPRATIDIDLMVQSDDLERAWDMAKSLGYDVEGIPLNFEDGAIQIKRISKLEPDRKRLITVDFLLVTERTRQIWADRETVTWINGTISTVSRQGLIKLKELSGRPQDRVDIERLENES